jgi:hypothetical protein
MKSLNVNKSNGVVRISVEMELDARKEQLYINEKTAESKFINILDKVKKFSKFEKMTLHYDEIDYYDNMVDVYETPYIHFTKGKGKRKPTISHTEHGCIPKDWSECYTLFLNDPKTIQPIEVFLSEFNISLNPKQMRELRKAIKGESNFHVEL